MNCLENPIKNGEQQNMARELPRAKSVEQRMGLGGKQELRGRPRSVRYAGWVL